MARPFSEELIAAFRGEVSADAERRQAEVPSFGQLDQAVLELDGPPPRPWLRDRHGRQPG